ncbi:hypothetical protein [Nitrosopumilus sp.]|uniref:hypothetical protein n=1 Tax=Nitrosopumilus sp. TaxID=2024843 RepID=UPI003D0BABC3
MQKIFSIFLFIGIFFIQMVPEAVSESDEYLELQKIYNEQRWNLEKEFKVKFTDSSDKFQKDKQAVYDKQKSDPTLTTQQINQMLQNVFTGFVERQDDIKTEYETEVNALNQMFEIKFEQFGNSMPLWVEKVMELWSNGQISDSEFVNFLSYVINNDIIKLEQWVFSKYND